MNHFFPKIKKGLLLVGDIALLYLALWLMLKLRFGAGAGLMLEKHFFAFSTIFPLWLISLYIFGLYDLKLAKNTYAFYLLILKATVLNGFLSVTLFYLFPNFFKVTPKTNLFLTLVFFGILFLFWRYLYNLFLKTPGISKGIIIIGKNPQTLELAKKINFNPQLGYKMVSLIEPEKEDINLKSNPYVYTIVTAVNLNHYPEIAKKLYQYLPFYNFENFPDFYEKITGKVPLSQIDEIWFLNNLKERERITYEKVKRLVDISIGLTMGAITVLVFPVVALVIKANGPGPVFYKQERRGRDEKPFIVYKFRTMKASKNQHKELWREKTPGEITKVGKVLRKIHLDEFPQFWSILKGNLSVVGPRPEWIKLADIFGEEIHFYSRRYLIKPGFTGWAQLNFPASLSIEEAREKFQYDLYYIKNRSLFLDLEIILKTMNLLFRGRTQ